jgi:hypothetical protein
VEEKKFVNFYCRGFILKKNKYEKKVFKHCCEDMDFFLKEKKVAIFYNPIFREYYIRLRSYIDGKQAIYACPWCGYKFPKSLLEIYIDLLQRDYGMSYRVSIGEYWDFVNCVSYSKESDKVPEEFNSDEWWKKRGL